MVIKGIVYFYKKYQDEALDILIHDTVHINQKFRPFYLINDSNLHKYVKYLTERIGRKDPHNQQILVKFLEQYDGREKNISRDNDSLQLSEII